MYDSLVAALLADHFSRRHHATGPAQGEKAERHSPWSRVFAWNRRSTCS